VEVSGNPAFVRQVLDDLPTLMARLRGEAPGRTAISMPAPPATDHPTAAAADAASANGREAVVAEPQAAPAPTQPPRAARTAARGGRAAAETRDDQVGALVFDVLRASARPLPISAIRERMDTVVSGQQVRRLLERAGDRVAVSADRPATYSLR
jgi:hypothetical protein